MYLKHVSHMLWFNLNEWLGRRIRKNNAEPRSIDELLVKEKEVLLLPGSPLKHFRLSSIYKQLANGYAIKTRYSGFDHSSEMKSYEQLASVHRTLGIELTKETNDAADSGRWGQK